MDNIIKFPHCDSNVLHGPKICTYCDEYPELQQYRTDNKINFTGENDPNKKQCPAEARRKLEIINRWYGNTPKPSPQPEENKDIIYFYETDEINDEGLKKIDFDKYNGISKKEK